MNLTWPVVALAGIVAAAFVGIFALIPESDATARAGLLAAVVGLSNAVVLLMQQRGQREVRNELEKAKEQLSAVHESVNGNSH